MSGFDGLAIDLKDPDQWHSTKLRECLASTGPLGYLPLTEWIWEKMRRIGIATCRVVWRGAGLGALMFGYSQGTRGILACYTVGVHVWLYVYWEQI